MKTENPSSVCFQYCIKLGQGKFASLLINQKSNLEEQAAKICKLHNIDPTISQIIRQDMQQEYNKNIPKINISKIIQQRPKSGTIKRNRIQTQTIEYRQPNILQQKNMNNNNNIQNGIKIKKNIKSNSTIKKKKQQNCNHFEQMYQRYYEIQRKKEISRKNSMEKLTFKPKINKLSDKIITHKRNTQTDLSNDFKCVIYHNNPNKTKKTIITQTSKKCLSIKNTGYESQNIY